MSVKDAALNSKMNVAICGAGLVGGYLYRLLRMAGYDNIRVFDQPDPHTTRCGINPGGWGALTGFEEKINAIGLKAGDYIVGNYDRLVLNEVAVKAKIIMIDKPRLIADLWDGVTISRSAVPLAEFDRVIDATGFARAYLPRAEDDLLAPCIQYRVTAGMSCEPTVYVGNLGYAWILPLSNDEYHIGAGSLVVSPEQLLNKLGWLSIHDQICSCVSKIRLCGVPSALPVVAPGTEQQPSIWGVGEAIGCVSPLMGEGIMPGLISASILVDNWENPESYRKAVVKEFAWTKEERQVLEKLAYHRPLGFMDAMTIRKSANRLKLEMTYYESACLLSSINRQQTIS